MDSPDQLVFSHVVESLHLRVMKGRYDDASRERLKTTGIDLAAKLLPAYALTVWLASIDIAAQVAFPGTPREEAQLKLGMLFIEDYREGLLGKALFELLRLLSPERILDRMAKNFRSGTNYTETSVTRVAPGCSDLWINIVGDCPEFTRGILQAGLTAAGVPEARVEISARRDPDATYRITWRAAAQAGNAPTA